MPCSPGMARCAATCGHRALVEGYRAERSRQMAEVVEKAGGYPAEIADLERQRAEVSPRGRPYPVFQDWLIDNRRPDVDTTYEPSTPLYAAGPDRRLLAYAMGSSPSALAAVMRLHPNDFTAGIERDVAVAIREIHTATGQPVYPDQVEDYLMAHGVPRTLSWDSTLPAGDRAHWQFGLHGWVDQLVRPLPDTAAEMHQLATETRETRRGMLQTAVREHLDAAAQLSAAVPPPYSALTNVLPDLVAEPVDSLLHSREPHTDALRYAQRQPTTGRSTR